MLTNRILTSMLIIIIKHRLVLKLENLKVYYPGLITK